MVVKEQFKYFAFISYSSKDTDWGRRLQNKLEHFKLPATLCNEYGWERRPIKPVFFAPTDIQPGGLTEELQERLKASKNLIVICSPNSAQSEWVGKEIEFFHSLGRTKNIHFFIVEGSPHSGNPVTECFNPVIDQLGLPEILGANIHEQIYHCPWLNKERAYVQLISKLIGVEFDAIWQRHKRLMVKKAVLWTIGVVVIITTMYGIWKANQNFDAEIRLKEASVHNPNLPPLKNANVTLRLHNEIKSDTILSLDTCIVFSNIPHRYLNKKAAFSISCPTFLDTTMTIALTPHMTLSICRDKHYYGDVNFRLYNSNTEIYLNGATVNIAGIETISDYTGQVSVFVPLEQQQPYYILTCSLPLKTDTIFMPCGTSEIIEVK